MAIAAAGALLGQGVQAYGADQQKQAASRAQAQYNIWQKTMGASQDANDAQLQAYLQQLSQGYRGDVVGLVDQFNPTDRMSAFNSGVAQQGRGIEQVLAAVNQRNPVYAGQQDVGGTAGLFANTQAREGERVAQATAPVANAAAMSGGLTSLAARDGRVASDFGDRANEYSSKIQDVMRLYGMSNAARNQALSRAAMQHQQDMGNAQMAGNGAMLAGGLLTAGSQAYGAYQAAQPSTAMQPGGHAAYGGAANPGTGGAMTGGAGDLSLGSRGMA